MGTQNGTKTYQNKTIEPQSYGSCFVSTVFNQNLQLRRQASTTIACFNDVQKKEKQKQKKQRAESIRTKKIIWQVHDTNELKKQQNMRDWS